MNRYDYFPYAQCNCYNDSCYVGFRLVSSNKGDAYNDMKTSAHCIIFVVEGECVFSCDNFLNRHFRKGDMFFLPHASSVHSEVLVDSKFVTLTFDANIESLCDACSLINYVKLKDEIIYDFAALQMSQDVLNVVQQVEKYISMDMKCAFMHKLKQQELFLLFQYCYTKEQIINLFYPIIGMFDFKSWVLENHQINMSLESLASKYNLNPKSFSRKFSNELGISFRKWSLQQKAKHILLRLSVQGTTFSDIVREFNFSDQRCFYTFCKEQYGCTATELLKKIRR